MSTSRWTRWNLKARNRLISWLAGGRPVLINCRLDLVRSLNGNVLLIEGVKGGMFGSHEYRPPRGQMFRVRPLMQQGKP